jgi:hypothetical protein
MYRAILLSGVALGALAFSAPADAAVYLNGVIASSVNASGTNVGEPSEYDSFATPNTALLVNGVTETPQLLNPGLNNLLISTPDVSYTGLGLFFTTDNVLLSTFGLAPDLNVYIPSGFAIPAAGTMVATLGQFSGNAPYSGATSFGIDGQVVTVVGWNGSTLSLNLASIPEPASVVLAAAGVALVGCRRRMA